MPEAATISTHPVAPDEPALDLGYSVAVDAFSGPLDLLLFLVRKSELDIIDIPVATIADQFVTLIREWQERGELDLEGAGDFILMAATLLEIKARTVAPPPVEEGELANEDEDDILDPRADLIGKLLAYRRFKEAVGLLTQREALRAQQVTRQLREDIPEDPEEATGIDLGELNVNQLSKLWYTLVARIGGNGPRTVMKDDIPIEGSIRKLEERATEQRELTLHGLFAAESTLQGRVTMLMATLECTRQRIVHATQHEQYGDVTLRFREIPDRVITPVVFPPEEGGKKRRRRPPLVTFQAPVAPTTDETEDAPSETPEEKHETDEERFLRELNETCDLDGVLARVQDVEKGFQAYWEVLHPTPPPAPAPVSIVVEPVPAPVAEAPVSQLLSTEPLVPTPESVVSEPVPHVVPSAELATTSTGDPIVVPAASEPVVSAELVTESVAAQVAADAVQTPVSSEVPPAVGVSDVVAGPEVAEKITDAALTQVALSLSPESETAAAELSPVAAIEVVAATEVVPSEAPATTTPAESAVIASEPNPVVDAGSAAIASAEGDAPVVVGSSANDQAGSTVVEPSTECGNAGAVALSDTDAVAAPVSTTEVADAPSANAVAAALAEATDSAAPSTEPAAEAASAEVAVAEVAAPAVESQLATIAESDHAPVEPLTDDAVLLPAPIAVEPLVEVAAPATAEPLSIAANDEAATALLTDVDSPVQVQPAEDLSTTQIEEATSVSVESDAPADPVTASEAVAEIVADATLTSEPSEVEPVGEQVVAEPHLAEPLVAEALALDRSVVAQVSVEVIEDQLAGAAETDAPADPDLDAFAESATAVVEPLAAPSGEVAEAVVPETLAIGSATESETPAPAVAVVAPAATDDVVPAVVEPMIAPEVPASVALFPANDVSQPAAVETAVATAPHITMPAPTPPTTSDVRMVVAEPAMPEAPTAVEPIPEPTAVGEVLPSVAVAAMATEDSVPHVTTPPALAVAPPSAMAEPVSEVQVPLHGEHVALVAEPAAAVPKPASSVPEPVAPAAASVVSAAPVPSRSAPSPSARKLTRTLLLLTAGLAGGSLAGWFVLLQQPEPLPLHAALPPTTQAPAVIAPAPAPVELTVPAITSQPALVPVSVPRLPEPSIVPSPELLALVQGPAEQWLAAAPAAAPWPVAVPWYACLPRAPRPAGIGAFAGDPDLSGVPVAAWACDGAWAWCVAAAPVDPFSILPPAAFRVVPLDFPAGHPAWIQAPDLSDVPVSAFTDPEAWRIVVGDPTLLPDIRPLVGTTPSDTTVVP